MKYNKIIKENEYNKNSFLITTVCSILLLLTLCYFGVNSGTYSYLNSNGLTQLDFTDYSCSNSSDILGSFVKTYLDGSSMVEDVRYDNHCIRNLATSTCYVTARDSGAVLAETCSQYNYDYYCTKTGSEVVYQRYKKCTRGTSVDYCDVQSSSGCGSLESQGYTCNWAESDVYSCTKDLDNGPADETTKTCVYGYLMSSDETDTATISKIEAYASDGSNCPCPGSSWNKAGANSCTQKITSSTSGYSYKKSGMDYCSSSFTSDGDSCVLENGESTEDTSPDTTKEDFSGGSVKITGTNKVGNTLTAVVTDTTPKADSYTYQWYYSYDSDYSDGGVVILGATSSTYKIEDVIPGSSAATFIDKYIYVQVFASKTGYNGKYLTDITDSSNNGSAVVTEEDNTKKVNVTLDANGGKFSDGATTYTKENVVVGEAYSFLKDPADRTNYDFLGWYTAKSGGTEVTGSTTVENESNHTLYAQWKAKSSSGTSTKKTFTATFDANGGKLDGTSPLTCTGTSSCVIEKGLPSATRECYTYKGWGSSASCTSGSLNSVTVSSTKQTFYACWVKDSSCDNNSNPDPDPTPGTGNTPDPDPNPGTDDENVPDNPPTGEVTTIALIWFVGLLAIGYAFYYFKNIREN